MFIQINHPKLLNSNQEVQLIGPLPLDNKAFPHLDRPSIIIDGGISHQLPLQNLLFSIGDKDSLSPSNQQKTNYPDFPLNQEKSFSDLKAALNKLNDTKFLSSNFQKIFYYGLSGGDMAHQLCQYLDSFEFMENQSSPKYISIPPANGVKETVLILSNSFSHQWDLSYQGEFSLINLRTPPNSEQKQIITIEGKAKYQGTFTPVQFSTSHGLHNIAQGEFQIFNTFPVMLVLTPKLR